MAAALFSTTGELAHLHRLVTRITLIGAASSALILVLAGAASSSSGFMLEAVGPALVSLCILPMVMAGKEHAAITFALASLSVVVSYKLVGSSNTTVAATTAVVVISALSTLFITRNVVTYISAGIVVMALVPVFWEGRLEGALATGLVMALAFVVASVAFILIRNAAGDVNSRYRLAFEDAPTALLELDWTRAKDLLEDVGDVDQALAADPGLLEALVQRTSVVRANVEAGKLFSVRDPSDLIGPVDPLFAHGPLNRWWREQYVALADGRSTTDDEVSLAEWGREQWVAVRTISGRNPAAVATSVVALNDVTATRLYEQSLKDLIDAKDEFIATVSHELRTPLTAVVGLATELAQADDLEGEERSELLDIVAGQSREISFIVEDLLVAARADIGRITVVSEPVALERIAHEVLAELSLDVNVVEDEEGLFVLGDPIRIRQVVRNLLVNAERYGGKRRRIVIRPVESEGWLEVRDSGDPIPHATRERIFEPYERAHDREGRTMAMGLGLSVSRRLARLMDGDLEYLHDGESVFRLILNRVPGESAATPESVAVPESDDALSASTG